MYFQKKNILTINIEEFSSGIPIFPVFFPKEQYGNYYYINTYLPYSVLDCISCHHSFPFQVDSKETLHLDGDYKAKYYLSNIQFNNDILISNFSLYFIENTFWFRDSGISLGYHFKDESFSLLHKLYNSKMIDHLQFAFHNPIENMHGHLYLGGIPNESHQLFLYKGVIPIDESLPSWGFSLNKVEYDNTTIQVNIPVIINNVMDYMLVSTELYQIIKFKLNNYLNNKKCEELEGFYELKYLSCEHYPVNDTIKFYFNSISILIKIKDLSDYSLFRSNSEKPIHNFKGGVIGVPFLNMFNYTIFDYENKQIEFYSDLPIIRIVNNNSTNNNVISLFGINILMCLSYIIVFYIKSNRVI